MSNATHDISWEDFKIIIEKQAIEREEKEQIVLYRSQSDSKALNPSLFRENHRCHTRFSEKSISAQDYHRDLCNEAKDISSLENILEKVPDVFPFIQCFFYNPDLELSKEQAHATFQLMVHLRHDGFRSPLLDWTRDPYIAAFSAFEKETTDATIFYLKIHKISEKYRDYYSTLPQLFPLFPQELDYFRGDPAIDELVRRHRNQQSLYYLLLK